MAELDQTLREIFGEPVAKLMQLQSSQMEKLMAKVKEIAREAMKDDITRMTNEITDLRSRVAMLEAERVRGAAEEV